MRPGQWLTRALVLLDNRGVDGAVNGVAAALGGRPARLRRPQTGFVRSYALGMLGGVRALVVAALLAGEVRPDGNRVADRPGWCCRWSARSVVGVLPNATATLAKSGRARRSRWPRSCSRSLLLRRLRRRRPPLPGRPPRWTGSRSFGVRFAARRRRHRAGDDRADRRAGAGRGRRRRWADKLPTGRTAGGFLALMLLLEAMMVGVFAATDVFLFYVFFEAMLIPMYFLIGGFGGAAPAVRGGEVLPLLAARRADHAGLGDRAATSWQPTAGPRHLRLRDAGDRGARSPAGTADVAVPRLLPRLRDQGAAGAVPHLAARRRRARRRSAWPCCWSACWTRSARSASCATACRCSRDASPGPRAAGAGARRRRHPLRRAAGDGPEGHEAAGRLHLDRALRLHRARHLRVHHAGRAGAVSTWSTTAISTGMLFLVIGMVIARGGSPDRRLRRHAAADPAAGRRVPRRRPVVAGAARHQLASSASSWCCWAPTRRSRCTRSSATIGIILAALYILLAVPADDAGPGARRRAGRRGRRPGRGAPTPVQGRGDATWRARAARCWRRCSR